MPTWLSTLTADERKEWKDLVANDLRDGGHVFGTQIYKEVTLDQWRESMKEAVDAATSGKIIINCQ